MRYILPAILGVLAAVTSGCVVPFPHVKQTCGPVDGKVVDSRTGRPVCGATVRIRYPDGDARETHTDDQGRFEFGRKYRLHWGVMIGIALNYSLPYDIGWFDFSDILIEAEGHRTVVFKPSPDHDWSEEYVQSCIQPHWPGCRTIQPPSTGRGDFSSEDSSQGWSYPRIPLPPWSRESDDWGQNRDGSAQKGAHPKGELHALHPHAMQRFCCIGLPIFFAIEAAPARRSPPGPAKPAREQRLCR